MDLSVWPLYREMEPEGILRAMDFYITLLDGFRFPMTKNPIGFPMTKNPIGLFEGGMIPPPDFGRLRSDNGFPVVTVDGKEIGRATELHFTINESAEATITHWDPGVVVGPATERIVLGYDYDLFLRPDGKYEVRRNH